MADKGPVRRAGMRIGLDGKCPSPKDGLSDPQNNPKGEYTENETAGTWKDTNEQAATAPGKNAAKGD